GANAPRAACARGSYPHGRTNPRNRPGVLFAHGHCESRFRALAFDPGNRIQTRSPRIGTTKNPGTNRGAQNGDRARTGSSPHRWRPDKGNAGANRTGTEVDVRRGEGVKSVKMLKR